MKKRIKTKRQILEELSKSIEDCTNSKIKKIGVACAGVIKKGIVTNSPNLPINKFNLENYLQKKFRKKVIVENDANCVALAEAKLGVKKKNFFTLTLGTGVGGGIIIDGKLYKGSGGAGELGHMILDNGKELEYFFRNKRKNLSEVSECIGQGIASLISVFDPEIVILAGGMTKNGKKFLKDIKSNTKKYMFLSKMPEIKYSSFEHPGIIGASLLFEDKK